MKTAQYFFLLAVIFAVIFFSPVTPFVYAAQYDLVAPTGQLARGQDVQFTINIDSQGQSMTTADIGMTYVTTALQYVSTTPGDAFPTVQTETLEDGKLMFHASNDSGFSGTGTFAVVTFKIIATESGSTELCVLFAPTSTPEPTEAPPPPTSLPKSGAIEQTGKNALLGAVFIILATGGLTLLNKRKYHEHSHHPRKSLH